MIRYCTLSRPSSAGATARGVPKLLAALAVFATAMTGCGDDGPVAPEPPDIESLVFAPELNVDLSQMTLTASGLYVRDLVDGDGPRVGQQIGVRFNYQGWLHDGTAVDKGVYPANQFSPGAFISPFDGEVYYLVGSGETIAAWDLGLDGMRSGGTRQLVVPPRLGFGGTGSADGRVPGNAVMVYVFELLAVEP
ncbi:MAG: FKBP-type peptidyl-prolyl cis-trans isomerase [Gemmatimonadetes bacterium]|nr:FKBP-type peptidyl-prolyl cis-trans isomerase [Gemmatimonadota bacterium]